MSTSVALSMGAGVMSFGIGTLVGSIAAVGITASVTSQVTVIFDSVHESFKGYAKKLDKFYTNAVILDENIQTELEMILKTTEDIKYYLDKENKDSLKKAVDLWLGKMDKLGKMKKNFSLMQEREQEPNTKQQQPKKRVCNDIHTMLCIFAFNFSVLLIVYMYVSYPFLLLH